VLPRALLVAGQDMQRRDLVQVGLESLEWLVRLQIAPAGHFAFVGCEGFYQRGGQMALYDQQPVEAYSTLATCLAAHRITGDPKWLSWAYKAFGWFFGDNDLGLPLYDPLTGGCQDGLHVDRINRNQGAESTLAYLLSALELHAHTQQQSVMIYHTGKNGKNG
jgi:hypothetical protein